MANNYRSVAMIASQTTCIQLWNLMLIFLWYICSVAIFHVSWNIQTNKWTIPVMCRHCHLYIYSNKVNIELYMEQYILLFSYNKYNSYFCCQQILTNIHSYSQLVGAALFQWLFTTVIALVPCLVAWQNNYHIYTPSTIKNKQCINPQQQVLKTTNILREYNKSKLYEWYEAIVLDSCK